MVVISHPRYNNYNNQIGAPKRGHTNEVQTFFVLALVLSVSILPSHYHHQKLLLEGPTNDTIDCT